MTGLEEQKGTAERGKLSNWVKKEGGKKRKAVLPVMA